MKEGEEVVCAVGYPGIDPTQDWEDVERIFGGILGRKRLAPGVVLAIDAAARIVAHDCSTLQGSSGSCVVRLSSGQVLGLHYRGDAGLRNEAVLLSTLAAEQELRNHGLEFAS